MSKISSIEQREDDKKVMMTKIKRQGKNIKKRGKKVWWFMVI